MLGLNVLAGKIRLNKPRHYHCTPAEGRHVLFALILKSWVNVNYVFKLIP